jgi:Ca2+-binding EF-hand superfamily protein
MDAYWETGFEDMTYYELDSLLAKIDEDKSGKVSFNEFLLPAISPIEMVSSNERIWKMLRQFDVT